MTLSESVLVAEVRAAAVAHDASASAVQARVDDILRPAGALARFDEVAMWVASWQRTSTPTVTSPVAIIFAGDHGVTVEGVSAYPAEVTGAMLAAFQQQKASVSAIASVSGTDVHGIDVGVGDPTGNIAVEPALSSDRFTQSFNRGRQAVAELCTTSSASESASGTPNEIPSDDTAAASSLRPDLLIFGEMGIGNTTAAAAVAAALFANPDPSKDARPKEVASFVGRGTGVGDAEFANKVQIVTKADERYREVSQHSNDIGPLSVLQQLGGTELAAIAGAMVEARLHSIPVLIDGYIASVPAAVLHEIDPMLVANVRAAHLSPEPGHQLLLDRLGLSPLLDLEMRLGEASGAVAAVPLVQMACKLVTDVPTFTEWFGATP